jgi:hypothetical protein
MITVIYLWRIKRRHVGRAVWHMAIDRRTLKADKSVGFFKLLGTGTGETFTPRDADPTLWGLLVTLPEDGAESFDTGKVVSAWHRFAAAEVRYLASTISAHGQWSGVQPFDVDRDLSSSWSGRVLALTRAKIRWSKNVQFWRAVPPVIESLRATAGLESAIGIGEAPIGLQGTLSIWSDSQAMRAFAYQGNAHSAVIRQTTSQGWYSEELFARFALREVRGSLTLDR